MENKNALVQAMIDVEYYPPSELVKMNIDMTETQKFPIEKAVALGVVFQPLTQLVSYAVSGAGQSGLYFVNTAGKTMFQSGGQFIGNLKAANGSVGGGFARMTQIPLDPTMLCMAVAIMAVEKKLDAIHEAQKEILAFLELKEEAKLKGKYHAEYTDGAEKYAYYDNKQGERILVVYKKKENVGYVFIAKKTDDAEMFYHDTLEGMLDYVEKTIKKDDTDGQV